MYGTFHGGLGMAFIVPETSGGGEKDGIRAQVVGHTTSSGRLEIVSRGLFRFGKLLTAPV